MEDALFGGPNSVIDKHRFFKKIFLIKHDISTLAIYKASQGYCLVRKVALYNVIGHDKSSSSWVSP